MVGNFEIHTQADYTTLWLHNRLIITRVATGLEPRHIVQNNNEDPPWSYARQPPGLPLLSLSFGCVHLVASHWGCVGCQQTNRLAF